MNTWKQITIKNGETTNERIITSDHFVQMLAQMIFLRQAGEDVTLLPEADSNYAVTAYICTRVHNDGTLVVTRFVKQEQTATRYIYTEKGAAIMANRFPGIKAGDTYDRPITKSILKQYLKAGFIAEAK